MLKGISPIRVLGLLIFAFAIVTLSSLISYSFIFPRVQTEMENYQRTLAFSQKNPSSGSSILGTYMAKEGSDSTDSHAGDSSNTSSSGSSGGGTSGNDSSSGGSTSTSGSSSGSSETSGSSSNSGSGSQTSQSSTAPTPTKKIEVEKNESVKKPETENETETEIEDRLEVETASHEGKIDLKKNGRKVKIENEAEGLKIKTEDEDGVETELADETIDPINNEFEQETGIRIEKTEDNKFVIRRGTVEAETTFPVTIDLTTKTLTIQTSSGERTLTVLPDRVVQNLINKNILDRVETNLLASQNQRVILTELRNQPVFEVKGADDKKFLGILPVTFVKTIFVSPQTGQVTRIDESLNDRFVEFFSF